MPTAAWPTAPARCAAWPTAPTPRCPRAAHVRPAARADRSADRAAAGGPPGAAVPSASPRRPHHRPRDAAAPGPLPVAPRHSRGPARRPDPRRPAARRAAPTSGRRAPRAAHRRRTPAPRSRRRPRAPTTSLDRCRPASRVHAPAAAASPRPLPDAAAEQLSTEPSVAIQPYVGQVGHSDPPQRRRRRTAGSPAPSRRGPVTLGEHRRHVARAPRSSAVPRPPSPADADDHPPVRRASPTATTAARRTRRRRPNPAEPTSTSSPAGCTRRCPPCCGPSCGWTVNVPDGA